MKLINSDYDPVTGITEEFHYCEMTNKITIRRYQDVEEQLDFNRQCFNSHNHIGYQDSEGGAHHIARIPLSVVERWNSEGFDWFASTDNERRAILNKQENKCLLVRPGRL